MKFLSLPFQGDIHAADGETIIPREEFGVLLSAQEVLLKAEEDVVRQKKEAEKLAEEIKAAAKEEGRQEGLETFNEHLIHFDKQLQALELEMQKRILPLALKAAKKIVGEQLELKPDTIVDIVMQALGPVLQNHRFKIYVNKADKEILEKERPRIKEVLEHVQTLLIQERDDVALGGCLIETESGIINATIENQWRALEVAFDRYMKS